MKIRIFAFFYCIASAVSAQDCKCENELKYVMNYYEENLPGFIDNVNASNKKIYQKFTDNLLQKSKNICNKKMDCYKLLLTLKVFFKDKHSGFYFNNSNDINIDNKEEVEKFLQSEAYKETEIIDNFSIINNSNLNEIENVYQSADSMIKVAVIKNKNSERDYVGVIIDSKIPIWTKGHVKFELKKTDINTYHMFLYSRDHIPYYHKNVTLENGILNNVFFNINLKEKKLDLSERTYNELSFKTIDSQTNYLYIPSFEGDLNAKLKAFFAKYDPVIQSKPYLIIDLRDNGGGSDACANFLLKYIYTKPFYEDNTNFYATKENIRKYSKWYESMKEDTINFSKEYMQNFFEQIQRLQAAKNKTFISISKGEKISLDTVLKTPKKVAIISNKNCASSCETLLFWALESDKTIIVGENSGGYVGYGEVTESETPNFNFILGATITRYRKNRKYEEIGIPPKFYLDKSKNWIDQTLEILKK